MDWAQFLVILLSIFLALFVILGVVLAVMFIKLTHQIKSVATSAEHTVRSIEDAVQGVGRTTASLTLVKTLVTRLKNHKRKQGK